MIRRKGKLKKSKQGSLLIIVVLILALAIIFISSAMMLTQATKDRLYDNAMMSQARLTVTAASEAFIEALETQEINDDQFDLLLSDTSGHAKVGQHTNNADKIMMLIDGVPGMSSNPKNCTYVDLYFPTSADVNKVAHADFTTIIGDEVENVKIILDIKEVKNTNPGNGFTNQIEVASSVGVSQLRFSSGLGMYDADKLTAGSPKDNTVLFRDNYFENESSNSLLFSDIVVKGDDATHKKYFCMGQNTLYAGDLIFLDYAYMTSHASNSWGFEGDFYFLGTEDSSLSLTDYDAGMVMGKAGGWNTIDNSCKFIFSNRMPQQYGAVMTVETQWNGSANVLVYNETGEEDSGYIAQLFKSSGTYKSGYGNANRAYFVNKNGESLTTATVNVNGANNTGTSFKGAGVTYGQYTVTNQTNASSTLTKTSEYTFDGDTATPGAHYSITDKTNYFQNSYRSNMGSFPSAATYFASVDVGDDPLSLTYPYADTDTTHYKSLNKVINDASGVHALGAGNYIDLPAGNYIITSSISAGQPTASNSPYVIALNGTKEYRFYFKSGVTFELENVVFAMYNITDTVTPPIFVLEDGAQVYLGGTTEDTHHQGLTCGFCSSGFLSMNRGISSASALNNYIKNRDFNQKETDGGEAVAHARTADGTKTWNYKKADGSDGNPIYYSKYYDGVHRPNLYVFGVSNNAFRLSFGTIIEGYVGMFDGGTFGIMNTKKAPDGGGPSDGWIIPIYGRVMATGLSNGSGNSPAGNVLMPYCPQPSGSNKINPVRPAVSKYHVTDVIYYYD
jgi:hypothetical protein